MLEEGRPGPRYNVLRSPVTERQTRSRLELCVSGYLDLCTSFDATLCALRGQSTATGHRLHVYRDESAHCRLFWINARATRRTTSFPAGALIRVLSRPKDLVASRLARQRRARKSLECCSLLEAVRRVAWFSNVLGSPSRRRPKSRVLDPAKC